MFITGLKKGVDKNKVSLQVFDLQKNTEHGIEALKHLASKGIKKAIALHHRYISEARKGFVHVSVIASSDMVRQVDAGIAYGSTSLRSSSQSPRSPWTSTTTSGPLANVLTYIDGQNTDSATSFEECSLSVTAIFSALVNLTDYMLSTCLDHRERNECKLGLAYFILSLQRLLEQPVIVIPGRPNGVRWQHGPKTGPFSAILCEKWLPMLVQKAQKLLNDNNEILPGPVLIATDETWAYRVFDPYGEFDTSGSCISSTGSDVGKQSSPTLLPSIDRVRMILDDNIYWPYSHVKCNQEIRMDPEREEVVVPCPMKFYNIGALSVHLERFHGLSKEEAGIPARRFYSCSLCNDSVEKFAPNFSLSMALNYNEVD